MGRLEKLVGNASIIILFQLFVCGVFAQDTTYVQQFDRYAEKLSKSKMQTSVLYDRVFSFAKLNPQQFSKEERDSIKNDIKNWKQVYLEMYNADYANSTKDNFDVFLEKVDDYKIKKKKIPIGIINYRFDYIDSAALKDGRIVMIDDKPVLSTLNNKSPYLSDSICLLSILNNQLYTGVNKIILDKDFYYTNTNYSIRSITLDFKDDKGKYILTLGDSLVLNFYTSGDFTYSYSIEFTNGKVVNADGMLSVISSGTKPCFEDDRFTNFKFIDYNQRDLSCYYEYGIYFDDCDNRDPDNLKKPILILDGFDPSNSRSLGNIFDLVNQGPNFLATKLLDEGHDIVICNFLKGGDFIERNALAVKEMLAFIKERTSDKIIVIGPSMGGLIARYALAQMEKENVDHQTSLYISFDAPHQGANIPIGDQYFLYFFGEVVGDASAREGLSQINSDAARQMLIHHQYENSTSPKYNNHRKLYLGNVGVNGKINSNGYPSNLRKVSIINGSGTSLFQGVNGKLFSLERFKYGVKIAESQIYSSSNQGYSKVAYCMAANPKDIFHARRLNKFASVIQNTPYPTNIDNVPGGYFNTQQIITGLEKGQSGNGFYVENAIHSFIPTVSALDLQFPTPYVNYNLNIKNANIYCNNQTPFDAYYAPDKNEGHVFISEQNSKCILREIENATKTVCVTTNTRNISAGQIFNYGAKTKNYYNKSFTVTNGGVVGVNMNAPTGYSNESIPETGSTFKLEGYNNECGSVRIDVNSNGAIILGDANSNVGEWNISDNTLLTIKDDGKLVIHDNSKLVIRRNSKLVVGKNASIQLLGSNAQLIIEGGLELEEDAVLSFSGGGYLNLKSNDIIWGRNSRLVLSGANMNAKVLEIAEANYLLQGYNSQSNSSIEIKDAFINLIGASSFINTTNKLVLENVTISRGKGLVLNGQKDVSISNCLFINNKVGLTCYSNQLEKFNVLGSPLILENNSFTNCDIAIKIFGKGFKIAGTNFNKCKQGIVADGMDMNSTLSNSNMSSEEQGASSYTNAGVNYIGIAGSALTIQNSTIDKFNTGIYNSQSALNLKCTEVTFSKYQNLWIANNASLNMGPSGNNYTGNNTLTVSEGLNNKNIFLEQANFINIDNGANKIKISNPTNNYFVAGTMLNVPSFLSFRRNNWYIGFNNSSFLNPPNQNNFIVQLRAAPSSPRVGYYNVQPILGLGNSIGCIDFNKPVEDPCEIPGSCNEYASDPLSYSRNSSVVHINRYTPAPYNIVLKQIFNQLKEDVNDERITNSFNDLCSLYLFDDKYDSSDVVYLKDLTYTTLMELFDKIYVYQFYPSQLQPAINFKETLSKLMEVQSKRYSILRSSKNSDREFLILMDMAQLKSKLGQYQEATTLFNEAMLVANTTLNINLVNHWVCITSIKEQMLHREFSSDQIDSTLLECQGLMTSYVSAGRIASHNVDTFNSSTNNLSTVFVNPNPSYGELTISIGGENEEIKAIALYNLQGDLVLEKSIQKNTTTYRLSTVDFNSGMYFLKVYTNSNVTTRKVLFNR